MIRLPAGRPSPRWRRPAGQAGWPCQQKHKGIAMGKRKRKKITVPIMLLWSKREQLRFCEAVERLQSLVNDLTVLVDKKKRQSMAGTKAHATRTGASSNGTAEGGD